MTRSDYSRGSIVCAAFVVLALSGCGSVKAPSDDGPPGADGSSGAGGHETGSGGAGSGGAGSGGAGSGGASGPSGSAGAGGSGGAVGTGGMAGSGAGGKGGGMGCSAGGTGDGGSTTCADLSARAAALLIKACTSSDECAVTTVYNCCSVYTGIRSDAKAAFESAQADHTRTCPDLRGCQCQDHTETDELVPLQQPPLPVSATCDLGKCTAHQK